MAKSEVNFKTKNAVIKQDVLNPEPLELIADTIIQVSKAYKQILDAPVKLRVILLLLRDQTNLPMSDIEKVLVACPTMEKAFIKD